MTKSDLLPELIDQSPLDILQHWINDARSKGMNNADAFSLATANDKGIPSNRVLLCKEVTKQGIIFYTNYQSLKGEDLNHQPYASANFYWDNLIKQISIRGQVQKTSRAKSEEYWATRPRDSQLSQWASNQSKAVESRSALDSKVLEMDAKYKNKTIPCPPHWGGYELLASVVEVWIGRPGRLHDRFRYTKVSSRWDYQRLYP